MLDGVTWGIAFDKMRLLQCEPTEIVEIRDDSLHRINEAMRRIRAGGEIIEVVTDPDGRQKEPAKLPRSRDAV